MLAMAHYIVYHLLTMYLELLFSSLTRNAYIFTEGPAGTGLDIALYFVHV